jgi:hypothetical protein
VLNLQIADLCRFDTRTFKAEMFLTSLKISRGVSRNSNPPFVVAGQHCPGPTSPPSSQGIRGGFSAHGSAAGAQLHEGLARSDRRTVRASESGVPLVQAAHAPAPLRAGASAAAVAHGSASAAGALSSHPARPRWRRERARRSVLAQSSARTRCPALVRRRGPVVVGGGGPQWKWGGGGGSGGRA